MGRGSSIIHISSIHGVLVVARLRGLRCDEVGTDRAHACDGDRSWATRRSRQLHLPGLYRYGRFCSNGWTGRLIARQPCGRLRPNILSGGLAGPKISRKRRLSSFRRGVVYKWSVLSRRWRTYGAGALVASPKAIGCVIIHNSYGLHPRIDDHRSHELESALLE